MIGNMEDLVRAALASHGATLAACEWDDARTLAYCATLADGRFLGGSVDVSAPGEIAALIARELDLDAMPPGDPGNPAPVEPEAPATRALRLEDAGGQFAIVDIYDDPDRAIVAAAVGIIAVAPDSGGRTWALSRLAGPDAVALAAVILRDVFPVVPA